MHNNCSSKDRRISGFNDNICKLWKFMGHKYEEVIKQHISYTNIFVLLQTNEEDILPVSNFCLVV